MRLCEMRGRRLLDLLADVFGPVCAIAGDRAACELFYPRPLPPGKTAGEFLLERAGAAVPVLLRGHGAEVTAVLAALDGVSPEEYGAETDFAKLAEDCLRLLTDPAFAALFLSAQTGTGGGCSGSARENIGEG